MNDSTLKLEKRMSWWNGGWAVRSDAPQLRQLLQTVELVGSPVSPQHIKAAAVQVTSERCRPLGYFKLVMRCWFYVSCIDQPFHIENARTASQGVDQHLRIYLFLIQLTNS